MRLRYWQRRPWRATDGAFLDLTDRGPYPYERGDVPGWVMVTLMTAGLVAAIFLVARPALVDLFNRAISAVNIP